ncbi:MAG: hypothetical protein ACLS3C_12395 [Oscillospiraceae bacterium]
MLPSDRAPKLWAVGGAIQPDGSAVVSVVLQGRGIVCGGSFTLTYDQSLSVQAEPSGTCQINAEPGKLRASFASATPVADQVSLLKLTIQNAVPGAIDLSNAIFRDDSGSRIAAADVRPTTLELHHFRCGLRRNAARRHVCRSDAISAGRGRERYARRDPGGANGVYLSAGAV